MKKIISILTICIIVFSCMTAMIYPSFAANEADTSTTATEVADNGTSDVSIAAKAIGAAFAVGLAAGGAAIGMGNAIAKSSEGISRQPEAEGKIKGNLMIGLVFIETAILYALIIAILVIFVL